jgi:hypothetical protein
MPNIFKLLVAVAAGISMALVAGVTLHTLSGGNDTVAYIGAGGALVLAASSIRVDG